MAMATGITMSNRTFWLHNFDTYTEKPRNQNDVGLRCRGNIQIHRLSDAGGLLVHVSRNNGEFRNANFYLPGLQFAEAYKTAWRLKRLLDRAERGIS
jgi:hypothetical protein